MIEPLRYNPESLPVIELSRPVYCMSCLSQKAKRNNPNIATKYCMECFGNTGEKERQVNLNEHKEMGSYLCKSCDEINHSRGIEQLTHHRYILVCGPGVRKTVLKKGDGVNFPHALDSVKIKLKIKVYHNGNMIHLERTKTIQYTAGMSGRSLHCQLLGAKNLIASDMGVEYGSSDLYVVYSFCGKTIKSSRIRHRTINPRWNNETFLIPLSEQSSTPRNLITTQKNIVKFEVYDYDFLSQNDFLGHVEVNRSKLEKLAVIANMQPIRLPLTTKEFHGTLQLRLGFNKEYLFCTVLCAEGLDRSDLLGTSNPYAKLYVGNNSKGMEGHDNSLGGNGAKRLVYDEYVLLGSTNVVYDNTNPIWKQPTNEFKIKIKKILKFERQIIQKKMAETFHLRHGNLLNDQPGMDNDPDLLQSTSNTSTSLFKIEVYDYRRFASHHLLGISKISIDFLRRILPNFPTYQMVHHPNDGLYRPSVESYLSSTVTPDASIVKPLSQPIRSFSQMMATARNSLNFHWKQSTIHENTVVVQPNLLPSEPSKASSDQPVRMSELLRKASALDDDVHHSQEMNPPDEREGNEGEEDRSNKDDEEEEEDEDSELRNMYRKQVKQQQEESNLLLPDENEYEQEGLEVLPRPSEVDDSLDNSTIPHFHPSSELPGGLSQHVWRTLQRIQECWTSTFIYRFVHGSQQNQSESQLLLNDDDEEEVYVSEGNSINHQSSGGPNHSSTSENLQASSVLSTVSSYLKGIHQTIRSIPLNNSLIEGSEASNMGTITWSEVQTFGLLRDSSKAHHNHGNSNNNGYLIVRLIPSNRGNVLPGIDEAVRHMSLGEKSKVKCRFDYAYNHYCMGGNIPPRSNMIFTIELLEINGSGRWMIIYRLLKRLVWNTQLLFYRLYGRMGRSKASQKKNDDDGDDDDYEYYYKDGKRRKRRRKSRMAPKPMSILRRLSQVLLLAPVSEEMEEDDYYSSESDEDEDELDPLAQSSHDDGNVNKDDDDTETIDGSQSFKRILAKSNDPKMRPHITKSAMIGSKLLWHPTANATHSNPRVNKKQKTAAPSFVELLRKQMVLTNSSTIQFEGEDDDEEEESMGKESIIFHVEDEENPVTTTDNHQESHQEMVKMPSHPHLPHIHQRSTRRMSHKPFESNNESSKRLKNRLRTTNRTPVFAPSAVLVTNDDDDT